MGILGVGNAWGQNILTSYKTLVDHIYLMKSTWNNNKLVSDYSPQTVLVIKINILGQIFEIEK